MSLAPTPTITLEQLLASEDRGCFEIVNGQLQEVNVSNYSTSVAAELFLILGVYCRDNRLGRLFGSDGYYRCFGLNGANARKPDISFISAARLPVGWREEGFFTIPPDLAVEILSPNDIAYEVNQKTKEYLEGGVKLVWIIDPSIREVMIFRLDGSTQRLRENDRLSGEDVLPGFSCLLSDFLLFP